MFNLFRRFPTLIHFTHAKAGSTWVGGILRELLGGKVMDRKWETPDFADAEGKVFASIFMERDEAMKFSEVQKAKRFFVMRDLRDTLVSRYFSIRDSHKPDPAGKIKAMREKLKVLSVEEGILETMHTEGMRFTSRIQKSWVNSGEIVCRYEELIANDVALFQELLISKLKLPVKAGAVEKAVVSQRFENVYQRKPGTEDTMSHGRKGVSGDWKNHFTPRIETEFQKRYGELLKATGYK